MPFPTSVPSHAASPARLGSPGPRAGHSPPPTYSSFSDSLLLEALPDHLSSLAQSPGASVTPLLSLCATLCCDHETITPWEEGSGLYLCPGIPGPRTCRYSATFVKRHASPTRWDGRLCLWLSCLHAAHGHVQSGRGSAPGVCLWGLENGYGGCMRLGPLGAGSLPPSAQGEEKLQLWASRDVPWKAGNLPFQPHAEYRNPSWVYYV